MCVSSKQNFQEYLLNFRKYITYFYIMFLILRILKTTVKYVHNVSNTKYVIIVKFALTLNSFFMNENCCSETDCVLQIKVHSSNLC